MKELWNYSIGLTLLFGSLSLYSQNGELCKYYSPQFKEAFKQQQKSLMNDRGFDVSFYRLALTIDPEQNFIEGEVTTYLKSSDSLKAIVFDLSNHLSVDSIYFQNRLQTTFIHNDNLLEIKLDRSLSANSTDSIKIKYSGIPQSNGFGSFVQDSYNGIDSIIWTLSQPYGAMEWWPCQNNLYDKADSVEIIITTPLKYLAASNGLLKKIDTLNSQHRFHWKTNYPIATYLIAVSVTNYELTEEKVLIGNDSLLLQHFMYPNDQLNLARSRSTTTAFLHFFDSLFGAYPFMKEKYGHASFTFGGGMEHQTMSFMGNYGGGLIAHELAHQWFGNKITCGSWQDLWLNEGFATYLDFLTYEFGVVHDPFFYDHYLKSIRQTSFLYPNQSVFRYDTSTVDTLFNHLTYQKGAATLHMLRWLTGDSAFFQGLRNYLNDSTLAYGFAKTKDLQRHLEKSSNTQLDEFFKDWVYGKGYPTYSTIWSQSNNELKIEIIQSQSDPSVYFFNMPIPLKLKGSGIDTTIIVNPRFSGDYFSIKMNHEIDSVIFDPQKWILAKSDVINTIEERTDSQTQLKLYPNPSNNYLYIRTNQSMSFNQIQIINNKGQVVLDQKYNSNKINLSRFSSGKYFLHLIHNEGRFVRSFVKTK